MTGKKQTKAKKKEETLLTTRGVKCALAATIADVEHGCGVKCVTQEKTRLKANVSQENRVLCHVLTGGIFETGAYGVPSKSQNTTVLCQGGPSSTQCSNPSWA